MAQYMVYLFYIIKMLKKYFVVSYYVNIKKTFFAVFICLPFLLSFLGKQQSFFSILTPPTCEFFYRSKYCQSLLLKK